MDETIEKPEIDSRTLGIWFMGKVEFHGTNLRGNRKPPQPFDL